MTMRSNDSQNKLHFRSDRIACENGQFFFSTREGALNGPYNTRHQAEVAASLFIRDQLDPTRLASKLTPPDPQFYRYRQRSSQDRRGDDRRLGERRQ